MVRIAVVEDEKICADQLLEYLQTYQQEFHKELEVSSYASGVAFLKDFRSQFDIILMDIEMPELDGMATAEQIRRRDTEVLILFITNMAQYAIRGYEVDALDYILKPVSYFAFSQRLNRAVSRIHSRKKHYVVVPVKGGARKLDADSIYYVESQGHNLVFHTTSGDYTFPGTMKEAEQQLQGLQFFRCNKGYLVSLQHVDGIQDGCAIVNHTPLLISRGRKNEFLEALANHIGGVTL